MKEWSLKKRSVFALSLLFSFCIVFGIASIVAYDSYTKAIDAAIRSNETRANLFAKLIQEHQRAAIGVLRSYASRPLLVTSVKRKDFEGTLRHLTDLTKDNPEMGGVFISNPDSTVWVNLPVNKEAMNKDLSDRDWYKGVSREWKPYISNVYKMIVGKKDLAVAVAVPLFDEKGKVIGTLATVQSTAFFRKFVSEVGLNFDADTFLIDQEGHIIYSNRFPYKKEVIGHPLFESIKKATKGEKGNVEIRDPNDGNRIRYVSFTPIEGIGWSIIVEKAKSEVLRSEYSYFALITAISFLTYVVVALSFVYLRGRQRQIRELEKQNEELEGRVRERTSELEAMNQGLKRGITERKRKEEQLRKLNECLVSFEADPIENINRLVALCGEQLGATCALYNRLEDGFLRSVGQWNTPPEFIPVDKPEGHVCFDLIESNRDEVYFVRNLEQTIYAQTDPNVACYNLKTYVGKGVFLGDAIIGSLCVVYQKDYIPSEDDQNFLGIVAAAIGAEERREHAEEALREEKDRAQEYLDVAGVMLVALDADQKVILINKKGCEILGYKEEEIIGKEWFDNFLPERYRERLKPIFAKLIAGDIEPVEYLENPVLTKSGKGKVIAWHNTVLRDGAGNIICSLSSGEDITERKQAEEALRESEERFRDLYDNAPVGYHEYDSKGQITRVNQTDLEMLGYMREEITGHYIWELNIEGEILRWQVLGKLAGSLPPGRALERTYRRKDGTTFPVLVQDRLIRDEEGRIKSIRCTIQDITEHKRAEEALRESEKRFRDLYDSAPVGYHEYDAEGRLTRVNRTELEMLGYAEAEMLGQPVWNFIVEKESAEAVKSKLDGELAPGQALERTYRRKDGTTLPVLIEDKLIKNSEGRIIGLRSTIQDISERKRAEEALRESEERVTKAFHSIPGALVISRLEDGKIVEVNDNWHKVFGYSREEVIGKSSLRLDLFADSADRQHAIDVLREQGFVRDLELQIRQKSGALRTVTLSSESLKIHGDQYLLTVVQDITERKRAEEALRMAEENFRRSLDESPLGVRIVTAEGETCYANQAMLNIYGYDSIEELRTTPVNKRYTPESYAEHEIRKEKRERGEYVPTEYEIGIVTTKGDIRYLQVFRKEVLWNNGKQFQTLYHDITERKRLEEILKQEQQELKLIIDSSPITVFYKDKEGRFLRVNKTLSEALKMPEEEFVGKTVFDLYSAKIAQSMTNDDQEVLKSGRPKLNIIEQYESASGIRWVQTDKIPIFDNNGISVGIIGFAQDITERKRAEEEGEKLLEQLKLGRKRLKDLSQRLVELQETERRDLARELHDKVGQGLTALIINLKIIRNLLPEESRKIVSARITDSRNLVEETVICIRDVMARLRPPVLDDYGLLAAVRWYSKQFVERTGIVMEVRGEELNPRLPLQKETTLFRIVQEAVTNVAKHSKASRVTLILEGGDGKARLTIADDGIGFDPKAHHQPESRPEWGVINMRERAESIGGEFHIEISPGKGTKIIVEVPRKE